MSRVRKQFILTVSDSNLIIKRRVAGDIPVGVPQPTGAGAAAGGRRQGVIHEARRGGCAAGPHLRLGGLLAGACSLYIFGNLFT